MADCLQSIIDHLDIPSEELEVIIVDNSAGKNAEEIKEIIGSHSINKNITTKYIHNSANLGYGQGNNVGIKNSSGEIVCIMNPDVRFGSKILKNVIQQFQNTALGLLAYKQIGGSNYSFYEKPEYKSSITGWKTKFLNKMNLFNSKTYYLSGAFFFLDKSKFEEIGLFDENIFMYYEEPDIANRLQNKNYEIIYDKNFIYYHLVGERNDFNENSFKKETEALLYYIKKNNIKKEKYLKNLSAEFSLKIKIAKAMGDNARVAKFNNELELVKSYFDIK
ncbi:GT2 family glycosyltransferase [Chryseobacterium limigenitum]